MQWLHPHDALAGFILRRNHGSQNHVGAARRSPGGHHQGHVGPGPGALGDKSLQRAKLEALSAREEMLLKRYKAEQGTGGIPAINIAIPKRL